MDDSLRIDALTKTRNESRQYMKTFKPILATAALIAVAFCGCETFSQRSHHRATSVMKFLYPHNTERVESTATPVLSLPLRVGIAFVPLEQSTTERGFGGLPASDATVNEAQKIALMKEVSKHFERYPFVKSIEFIPSAYLTPGGSFANLEQLRTMFGVDVIALLSYDQVQFTDENLFSLSYWTIVGIYTIQGERNDTHTMLDAVVYDIPSRKMLFRAPGISHIKGGATPVDLSKKLREDSQKGFTMAASDLTTNLDFQLNEFKDRIRKSPDEIKVVAKPGYAGAAAMEPWEVVLLCGLTLAGLTVPRRDLPSPVGTTSTRPHIHPTTVQQRRIP
jgi:rhombotail lipoprotein